MKESVKNIKNKVKNESENNTIYKRKNPHFVPKNTMVNIVRYCII